MTTVTSPGIGSGLDVQSIVPAIVDAEIKANEVQLETKQIETQAKITAVGSIKSTLSSFQTSLNDMSTMDLLTAKTITSSDADVLTATADETALLNSYDINVTTLATAHSVSSAAFAATTTTVGYGDLEISIGDYDGTFTTTTVTIASGSDTLADIKQAINDSAAGVTASIINDGSGYKLSLVSDNTGTDNQIKITVRGDGDGVDNDNGGLSQLAYDKTLSAPQSNLTQNVTAVDAALTINGISITSNSNTLTDNIDGLTLSLKSTGTSTVSLTNDTTTAKTKIEAFITSYNDTMSLLTELGKYNTETGETGTLQGDALARTLTNQLRRYVYNEVDNITGNYSTITDLGITTDADNNLVINDTKLDVALQYNFEDVSYLFARGAYTTDSLLEVEAEGTGVAAGVYAITLDSGTIGSGTLNGTIGGVSATASDGVLLEGSDAFKTLSINVLGGSLGNRGNVIVFDGLSKTLNDLIDSFIGDEGIITTQLSLLDEEATSLSEESALQAEKRAELEAKYYQEYANLDVLMAQIQNTSNYLKSALESLPGTVKKK